MGRRVVVTGIGLICGVGNTAEEVWKNLLAGQERRGPHHEAINGSFKEDLPKFACQIAAEVKNFDPLQFIEKKELKKMGRFIHLALAAADEAMKASGLRSPRKFPSESASTSGPALADSMSSSASTSAS